MFLTCSNLQHEFRISCHIVCILSLTCDLSPGMLHACSQHRTVGPNGNEHNPFQRSTDSIGRGRNRKSREATAWPLASLPVSVAYISDAFREYLLINYARYQMCRVVATHVQM